MSSTPGPVPPPQGQPEGVGYDSVPGWPTDGWPADGRPPQGWSPPPLGGQPAAWTPPPWPSPTAEFAPPIGPSFPQAAPPAQYPPGYPATAQPPAGYPSPAYPAAGYPPGSTPAGYPPPAYPPPGHPPAGYPLQGGAPAGYPPQGQPSAGYPPVGYPPPAYPVPTYPPPAFAPGYGPASGPRTGRRGLVLTLLIGLLAVAAVVTVLVVQPWRTSSPAGNRPTVEVTGGDVGTPVTLTGPEGTGTATVTRARWTSEGEVAPEPGTVYLVLDVTIEGVTGKLTTGGVFTAVIAGDGRRHSVAFGPVLDPLLTSKVLQPGDTNTGQLGYQLVSGPARVEFQSPDGVVLGSVAIPGP